MKLNNEEMLAVREAIYPGLADIRAFDFANGSDRDIYDLMEWAYASICDNLGRIYDDDVPF